MQWGLRPVMLIGKDTTRRKIVQANTMIVSTFIYYSVLYLDLVVSLPVCSNKNHGEEQLECIALLIVLIVLYDILSSELAL